MGMVAENPRTRVEVGREDPRAMGPTAKQGFLAVCRTDPHTFVEYVIKNEKTGEDVRQSRVHMRMHALWDAFDESIIMAHPESGKTSQALARVLMTLGKNPNLRLGFLNKTQTAAMKNLSVVKGYIEKSPELHDVYPDLLPGEKWADEAITVRRSTLAKDPTIQTFGYLGGTIQGSRLNGLLVDDLLDFELTRTTEARVKLAGWWETSVTTRLEDDAFIWMLANAWHPEDLVHELEKIGWPVLRLPVMVDGVSTWPEQWPLKRIEKKRRRMSAIKFAQQYLCQPRDDGAMTFLPEALELCKKRGRGYGLLTEFVPEWLVPGSFVVTGVDLAAGVKRTKGAVTCLFTIFFHPNGLRQVVGIRSGRWSARQIFAVMREVAEAFGGVMVVEDNGMQRHLLELAQEVGENMANIPVPVLPFTTGKNKVDPVLGIDNMAAEMESGRWLVPVGAGRMLGDMRHFVPPREVQSWLGELAGYDPNAHPGDRLMASWMARTHGMVLQRRLRRGPMEGGVRARVLGGAGAERDAAELLRRQQEKARRMTKRFQRRSAA